MTLRIVFSIKVWSNAQPYALPIANQIVATPRTDVDIRVEFRGTEFSKLVPSFEETQGTSCDP